MRSIHVCGADCVRMPKLLEIEQLSVSFATPEGAGQVLDAVSLSVGAGEIVGLVGESGSGKSTLGRAILGSLPLNALVTGGDVRFAGEHLLPLDRRELRRRISGRAITFIPQDPFSAFNPLFPIGTQIMDLMRWKSPHPGHGRARREADREAVRAMLQSVRLPDPDGVLRKLPHEVSGGQRQRLMIAMALLPSPALLIADEPTTALDVTIQAQILRLLHQMARQRGVAVLFTTHDLGTAYEICDRIVVLYAGQEAEVAKTADFFDHPAHPYTAMLLDNLPRADEDAAGIPGEVPNLMAPPPGCRFHPRCDRALPVCATTRPPPQNLTPDHIVRCHNRLAA
jgi:peptide/nickel transport system ATP-binding protein